MYQRYIFEPTVYDSGSFQQEIDEFNAASLENDDKWNSKESGGKARSNTSKKKKFIGFKFNPNTIDLSSWKKLGLSEAQAKSILKYQSKGGTFKIKSDLKKMYTISDKKYQELLPWIDLPEEYPKNSYNKKDYNETPRETPRYTSEKQENNDFKEYEKKPELALKSINLNTADTTQLKAISGIGSYYARKIIEYREELGGYQSINQLLEIWKMKEETVFIVDPYVFIDQALIRKLNINTVTIEKLKSHPYVSWKIANAIVNYRLQHGNYNSLDDLTKIVIIKKEDLEKIKPYIII